MKIFTCNACHRACEIITDDPLDVYFPSQCPYGGTCKWEHAYHEGVSA